MAKNLGDRGAFPAQPASSAASVVAMACSQNRSCRQTSSESLSLKRAYIAPTDDLARRTISETVALSKPFSETTSSAASRIRSSVSWLRA